MHTSIARTGTRWSPDTLLKVSAAIWFGMASVGLALFFVYVVKHYLAAFFLKTFGSANAVEYNTSFIAGDIVGNAALALHLSLALLVIAGGLLQLIPSLRARYPKFHRFNGRLFVVSAVVCSLAGQYLIFTRDIPGDRVMDMGTSIAGLLVLVFSYLTVTNARAANFTTHRRWAIRLFLVANAGWFFRIGLMLWIAINQAPVGIDMETFTGPTTLVIAYAQFLVPLLVAEIYFRAQLSANSSFKVITSMGIFCLAILTLAGVAAASLMMWFPSLIS